MANVVSITNPVFATEDGTAIDCVLQVDAFPAPVPFTASVNDNSSSLKVHKAKYTRGVPERAGVELLLFFGVSLLRGHIGLGHS